MNNFALKNLPICFLLITLVFGDSSILLAEDQPTNSGIKVIQNPQQIHTTTDYTGDFVNRSTISGDWGGTRQELANQGVSLDANLTQVYQSVVSGGLDTGGEYMGRGEVTLNLDTAKMGLWPGGLLTVMGEGNFGNMLTKNTGSLLGVNANELFPETDNSFLVAQLTYTQFLSSKFGIALGKFATISDVSGDMNAFAHGKGNTGFMNLAFNINPVSALTVPYSTLGLSTIFLPTSDLIVTAAILDPHGKADSSGFDSFFENGETYALEGRYTTNFFGKKGHQLLGGTYSTSTYTDLDQSVLNLIIPALPTQEAEHSWSAYWNMDQYFYQPNSNVDKGMGFFARFGLSDGEANPIENFASFGIGGKGMIAGRENDNFGIGYFYTWLGDNRITSQLGFKDSQGVELYYEYALTPAIRITPDIQWIQPSQERVEASWIAGVRLNTKF